MIRQFVERPISILADAIRRMVSDAVADAVPKGIEDGFARVSIELSQSPDISVVRPQLQVLSESSPRKEEQARLPLVPPPHGPNNSTPAGKRPRGRPRKFLT